MADSRLTYLFTKQLQKKTTDKEKEELMFLLAAQENEEQAKDLLGSAWEDFNPGEQVFNKEQSGRMLKRALLNEISLNAETNTIRHWFKYVSAAVLLITLSTAYFFFNKSGKQAIVTGNHDIAPGTNAATLTLANGRKIFLSDALKGKVAVEAGVNIMKAQDGQVAYSISDLSKAGPAMLNVISTANGEQYKVILPDGTKVWLNAASSIKFPVTFAKAIHRKVELSGEAFFEVVKDKKHPFIVKTARQEVKVLGTHFNVSAYPDELDTKTTLMEGSVHVTNTFGKEEGRELRPGQQSVISGETFQVNHSVDLEDVLAWKNGYFRFSESLESIMNKISRWYNVEVVYEVNPGAGLAFEGKISKKKTLSVLLKNIESAGDIHFKIEGRRVTVIK